MKLASIERDLRNYDPKLRYWIRFMQEQILSQQQQLNQCADVLVSIVETLKRVQKINLDLNNRWERQLRGRSDDPDLVSSVINKPEDAN